MTLQTKMKKLIEHPFGVVAILNGVNPNHTYEFYYAEKMLGKRIRTLIDVGANKGDFSRACLLVNKDLNILAFDPVPNVFSLIMHNVRFFNIGLSNIKQQKDFYVSKINDAYSTFLVPVIKSEDISRCRNQYDKTSVEIDRFDNLNLEFEKPCMLKIDAEGSELQVLQGFGDRLKEVDCVLFEYLFDKHYNNSGKFSRISSLLEKYGFDGLVQLDIRFLNNKLYVCDFLFWRIER